ncbi:MAG: hypothetical protein DLM50_05045 [Candidatus Meridianibacter frigidus]|nr:MAG: hypothetical protein DLM50_05045 [Candidatus Eremiobacteraeota bacterium]
MNYEAIAIWSQVISSILFMVVLVWMFRKFIIPLVMTAQKNKNEEIARAEQHRDAAKVRLNELRTHVGIAETDAEAIKARASEQAQREHDAALAEARSAGDRALQNAEGELERARAAAREQLRTELLDRAIASAREKAVSRVTAGVNAQLLDRFVSAIEHGALN